MKISAPSANISGRSNIAAGLAMAVLSLGLAFGAYAAQGFTEEDDRVRGNPQAPLDVVWNIRISRAGTAKNFSRKPGRSCFPNTSTPAKFAWCIVISPGPPAGQAWIPPWPHAVPENRDSIGPCTTGYSPAATNFQRPNSSSRLKRSSLIPSNLLHALRGPAIPRISLRIAWREANWVSGAPRISFCTPRMILRRPSQSPAPFPTRSSRKRSTSCSKRCLHPKYLPNPCKVLPASMRVRLTVQRCA